jgi:uncharacterized membrane protein YhhN
MSWALLGVAAVAAVVDWAAVWSDAPGARLVERVAKPAALLALLLVAAASTPATPAGSDARPWLVLALALSLAGDVLLLPPGRFVGGLVAFLLAHLAYLVAFAQLPGSVPWLVAGTAVAIGVGATVGRAIVRAASRAGLGLPVAAYLVVICAMAIAATRTGIPAAIAGAWLFVASDSMLGWGRFRAAAAPAAADTAARGAAVDAGRGGARLRLGVIVTYHLGQALLVLAILLG